MKYIMSIKGLSEICQDRMICKNCEYRSFCDYISRQLSDMTPTQMIAALKPEYTTKKIEYEE